MRIDKKISKKKYDQELAQILDNALELRRRGCFILNHSFPLIDALFVPKVSFNLIFPGVHTLGPDGALNTQMIITRNDVTGRAFGVRIDMTDYNVIAPSVMFMDAHTWEPAQFEALPKAQFTPSGGTTHFNVLRPDLATGAPFLCLEGIREFYNHPQHDNENWFVNRAGFGLYHVIDSICRTFCEYTMPIVQLSNAWTPVMPVQNGGQDGPC